MAQRRYEYAARLDRLSAAFRETQSDGQTVGDMLDRVSDADARALLARCVATLTATDDDPEVSDVDRAPRGCVATPRTVDAPTTEPEISQLWLLAAALSVDVSTLFDTSERRPGN